MKQNEHLRESSDLADLIQQRLGTMHPGPSRGVKQAGFRVLVTAYMPAVLVEIGFGTNPREAQFISDPRKQDAIAGAIADAAMEYLDRYERRVKAATPAPGRYGERRVGAPDRRRRSLFQNPIVLAAGTAGYGEELDARDVARRARRTRDEGRLARAARRRARAARRRVRRGNDQRGGAGESRAWRRCAASRCPGSRRICRDARKIVNVVGFTVDEYPAVVAGLESGSPTATRTAVDAYELNVSCPNVKAGGMEFGADPSSLRAVVAARARRDAASRSS